VKMLSNMNGDIFQFYISFANLFRIFGEMGGK